MLREFGFEAEMEEIETHERAYSLYQGALAALPGAWSSIGSTYTIWVIT